MGEIKQKDELHEILGLIFAINVHAVKICPFGFSNTPYLVILQNCTLLHLMAITQPKLFVQIAVL